VAPLRRETVPAPPLVNTREGLEEMVALAWLRALQRHLMAWQRLVVVVVVESRWPALRLREVRVGRAT
jgi:hypothetical protein